MQSQGIESPSAPITDDHPEIRESVRQMHRVLVEAVQAFGGIEAVARELGKTPKRLQAELDSMMSTDRGRGKPKMGMDDALDICKLTGDVRLLEIMAGPGYKIAPMPPPSEVTDDPRRLVAAAARNFNIGAALWASCHPDRLGELARPLRSFAELLAFIGPLAEKTAVSKNELRELHRLGLDVLCALDPLFNSVVRQVLIQSRADLHYGIKLLDARLPEWARPASRRVRTK